MKPPVIYTLAGSHLSSETHCKPFWPYMTWPDLVYESVQFKYLLHPIPTRKIHSSGLMVESRLVPLTVIHGVINYITIGT